MAGYVLDKEDRMWLVVFLVNHSRAGEAKDAMDALLTEVYASNILAARQ
jgi:D-alanyl-D-alanine carboxypeptidase/D-alanyl-D-alanine-endopeptidase (penicillin-binding protein 4)